MMLFEKIKFRLSGAGIQTVLLFGILFMVLPGCMDDDSLYDFDKTVVNRKGSALFIVNEGNFMYGNASLSYYNPATGESMQNIFYNTNALPLGDVAYSMNIRDSLGYVVINNSGKIYIINLHTFKYTGKITGLTSPRHIFFVNKNKAYVSDLYAKALSVIDLKTNNVTGTIPIDNHNPQFYQHPSEQMIGFGDSLFVNCWSYDNKILLIDTRTDKVIDSLTVGKQPNSMVLDKHRKLWVLSDGGSEGTPYGQENASLAVIDAAGFTLEKKFVFKDFEASPSNLVINPSGDSIWYLYNNWSGGNMEGAGVYAMSVTADKLPDAPVIPQERHLFYALGIDPENGDVYVSDAIGFIRPGKVYRYSPEGSVSDTVPAGIIPGYFCFVRGN